jgi:hypothetical protein
MEETPAILGENREEDAKVPGRTGIFLYGLFFSLIPGTPIL